MWHKWQWVWFKMHCCFHSDKKTEVALELKEEVEQLRKNAQKLHQEVCVCVCARVCVCVCVGDKWMLGVVWYH